MYIVGLNGSPNKDGNTYYLINKIFNICNKEGIETEIINIPEVINACKTPFCTCCTSPCEKVCYKGTPLEEVYGKVTKADAVVIGSPVYFGSMTAQLKAFFDKTRAVRANREWIGKPAAALSVGGSKYGGQESTIKAIHDCMLVEGMTIIGSSSIESGAGHHGVAAHRPACDDEFANQRLVVMAQRLIDTVK